MQVPGVSLAGACSSAQLTKKLWEAYEVGVEFEGSTKVVLLVDYLARGMYGSESEVQVGCLTLMGPFAPYATTDQSLTLLGSVKSHSTVT